MVQLIFTNIGGAAHTTVVGTNSLPGCSSPSGSVSIVQDDQRVSVGIDGTSDGGGLNEHVDIDEDDDTRVAVTAVALE